MLLVLWLGLVAIRHWNIGDKLLLLRQILVTMGSMLLLCVSIAIHHRGTNVLLWQTPLHHHLMRMLLLRLLKWVLMMQRTMIHD